MSNLKLEIVRMLNLFMNDFVDLLCKICVCRTGLESRVWINCCVRLYSFALLERAVVPHCKLGNY
jgi:hypothetical protein